MNKKIWITGASSGIGKSLAIKFAREGWQVAASARRTKLLEELNQNDSNIHPFPLDVVNLENSNKVFKEILEKFEQINLCVFCTGTYDPNLEREINVEQIKNVFEVNFFGTLNCIKSVEAYFKNKKDGHIAIVSSLVGYRGLPNSTGYTPSKAALNNLTEGLYFDFKRYNVRISLITPGFIKTPMTDKNTFKMPFLRTPEFAANKIFDGLIKKKAFEISFPIQISIILKILKILPNKIYLYLMKKLTKFQKR